MFLSNGNQSTDLERKSIYWSLQMKTVGLNGLSII